LDADSFVSKQQRDARIRLAVDPRHVRFHESLQSLRFVGEQQTKSRSGRGGSTPGAKQLAQNLETAHRNAENLLKTVREFGVPVPLRPRG
jgi:hypothetical protein